MTDPIFDAFDDGLSRLSAGQSLDECLRAYPDLAADLRPMLEAAQVTMAVGRVPHHVQMRSRARFLAAAAKLREPRRQPGLFAIFLSRSFSTGVAVLAGFVLGTSGLYYVSANSLPGDTLYGAKRALENARIQLAADPSSRFDLEEEFNDRRASEAEEVRAEDRTATLNFGGPFISGDTARWQVGDFSLSLTDRTEIVGVPQPGFYVDVTAENHGGLLTALRLAVEEIEVAGELARTGNDWSVNGEHFAITANTSISGALAAGETATVRIRTLHTGDQVATSVTLRAPATDTPEPSPTPSPLPPSPTATPIPTNTPPPTPAPTLASTPQPILQPATAVPETQTAEPTHTTQPTSRVTNSESGDDKGGSDSGSGDNSGSGSGDDKSGNGDGDDNSGPGGGGGGSGGGHGGDDDGGDDHSETHDKIDDSGSDH